jgi:hypothetical protein
LQLSKIRISGIKAKSSSNSKRERLAGGGMDIKKWKKNFQFFLAHTKILTILGRSLTHVALHGRAGFTGVPEFYAGRQ